MPDSTEPDTLRDAHMQTRNAVVTALIDAGQEFDAAESTANLAIALGDTLRHWKRRAEIGTEAVDGHIAAAQQVVTTVTDALAEVEAPVDAIGDSVMARVNALCALTRRYYHVGNQAIRDRDAVSLRLSGKSRTLPLSAGTYHHDSRDYAIIVDRQGRALAVDATRTDGYIEISGSDVVLDNPAALRAVADTLNAIANHVDERPTT